MNTPIERMITRLLACAALAVVPRVAQAQLPIPSVAIVGGVTHYDLNGSGSAAIGAIRADIPLIAVVGEGSLGLFRAKENDGTRTYIIPEAQLQWQLFPMLVRPYIGAGAGWIRSISGPDPSRNDLTLSASAGVRFSIPLMPVGLRAEARVRGIGSGFSDHATEFTVGVSF